MSVLFITLAVLVGAAIVGGTAVFFLRARFVETLEPRVPSNLASSAAPVPVAQEVKAIGDQIEKAMSEQRLQGETQRQLLTQKLDSVRQAVDSQRNHVDGLRNELRHEVRRRDEEINQIKHQIATISTGGALPATEQKALLPAPATAPEPTDEVEHAFRPSPSVEARPFEQAPDASFEDVVFDAPPPAPTASAPAPFALSEPELVAAETPSAMSFEHDSLEHDSFGEPSFSEASFEDISFGPADEPEPFDPADLDVFGDTAPVDVPDMPYATASPESAPTPAPPMLTISLDEPSDDRIAGPPTESAPESETDMFSEVSFSPSTDGQDASKDPEETPEAQIDEAVDPFASVPLTAEPESDAEAFARVGFGSTPATPASIFEAWPPSTPAAPKPSFPPPVLEPLPALERVSLPKPAVAPGPVAVPEPVTQPEIQEPDPSQEPVPAASATPAASPASGPSPPVETTPFGSDSLLSVVGLETLPPVQSSEPEVAKATSESPQSFGEPSSTEAASPETAWVARPDRPEVPVDRVAEAAAPSVSDEPILEPVIAPAEDFFPPMESVLDELDFDPISLSEFSFPEMAAMEPVSPEPAAHAMEATPATDTPTPQAEHAREEAPAVSPLAGAEGTAEEAATDSISDRADDLTVISSIDADTQRLLYQEGVLTLDQIARWGRGEVRRISVAVQVPEETIMNQWIFEAQAALFNQFAQQASR